MKCASRSRGERLQSRRSALPPPRRQRDSHAARPRPLVLWRLHGAVETLVCAATENSFGHALVLTLAGELILLELHPSIDDLVDTAVCLKQWLIFCGWRHNDDSSHPTPEE